MRTWFVAAVALLALSSCTESSEPLSPKEQLVRDARKLLPHDELITAIPDGFTLDRIVVNDDEYHRKGWVTVGVRLQDGPVPYARAIFYVLPDRDAAHFMLAEQMGPHPRPGGRGPQAFDLELGIPNRCDPEADGLYWCRAGKGRIYMVTQSSLGTWPPKARVKPEEIEAAGTMLEAFGGYLTTL